MPLVPLLGDTTVDDTAHRAPGRRNLFSCGRRTHQLARVHRGRCPARDHPIALGNLIMDLEVDIGKRTVEQAVELVKSLKNEPPVNMPEAYRINDPEAYDYDAQAQLDTLGGL